jgi:thiol-disulfide isomerase/thioredoxin
LFARLGLAVVEPRAALAIAGDRKHAGRSGSDLLLVLLVFILVTQARGVISAVWLGIAVEAGLGARALITLLTDSLVIVLIFLVVGALVIWLGGGRRDLGRASDFACVAVLPIVFVELVATLVVLAFDLEISRGQRGMFSLLAFAWAGVLITLGVLEARRMGQPPEPPLRRARIAAWGLTAIVLAGVVLQTVWVVRYLDRMRPVRSGDPAPAFALPKITANGALGDRVSLADVRGKIVILDFWATWCQPCLKAMPRLEAFQQKHATDVVVIAINIDDPAEARLVFDEAGYKAITLLMGDQATSDRYDVGVIPHTVVIDRQGVVRAVHRGGKIDLEREIQAP